MIFPSISPATGRFPFLGAEQAAPNSDPPRAEIDRSVKRPETVTGPRRRVRIYINGPSTPTRLRHAIHGKALMSVTALPVTPRPRARASTHGPTPASTHRRTPVSTHRRTPVSTHRPAAGVGHSHDHRMVQAPGSLIGPAAELRRVGPELRHVGSNLHRRSLPGHMSHHRSRRNVHHLDHWLHRRRSRGHAATTAMSDPDQEFAANRVFGRFRRRTPSCPVR